MDALNLKKGDILNLEKDGKPVSHVRVGLGWDVAEGGPTMDLDLFIHQKNENKTAFFGNQKAIEGVILSDDNLTGEGDGDDEFAIFDAVKTADGELYICLNIYDADKKNQTFAGVKSASARVYNEDDQSVMAEYKITEEGGSNTALIVGKLIDAGDTYKFEAIGKFITGDINQVVANIRS